MSLAQALVAAVWARLTAGVDGRVYEDPPASAAFPHVALGPWKARAWHEGDEEIVFAVRALARSRGEAMTLMASCRAALEASSLVLGQGRVVGLFFVDSEAVQLKGGTAWQASARYRALVEA